MIETTTTTGTSDNDVVYTSQDVSLYTEHFIQPTTGALTIQATLDGTNWTGDLAVEDLASTTPATRVATTATAKIYVLKGRFKKVRLLQDGATGADGVIIHAEPD